MNKLEQLQKALCGKTIKSIEDISDCDDLFRFTTNDDEPALLAIENVYTEPSIDVDFHSFGSFFNAIAQEIFKFNDTHQTDFGYYYSLETPENNCIEELSIQDGKVCVVLMNYKSFYLVIDKLTEWEQSVINHKDFFNFITPIINDADCWSVYFDVNAKESKLDYPYIDDVPIELKRTFNEKVKKFWQE